MFKDFREFSTWEKVSTDTIDFKKIYVDVAEDLVAGLLLSQIVYWYLPAKDGKTKLRVKHGGHLWIVKKRTEWYDEIRLSEANYKTAVKKLEKKNIVVKEVHRFDGKPTTFLRLNIRIFLELMNKNLSTVSTGTPEENEFYDYLNDQVNIDEPYSPNETVESTETETVKSTETETVKSTETETVESTEPLTESTNIDYVTENTNKEVLKEKREEEEIITRAHDLRNIRIVQATVDIEYVTLFPERVCREIATNLVDQDEKILFTPVVERAMRDYKSYIQKGNKVHNLSKWFAKAYITAKTNMYAARDEEIETVVPTTTIPFYNWLEQ